jgi:hypothetical protein
LNPILGSILVLEKKKFSRISRNGQSPQKVEPKVKTLEERKDENVRRPSKTSSRKYKEENYQRNIKRKDPT